MTDDEDLDSVSHESELEKKEEENPIANCKLSDEQNTTVAAVEGDPICGTESCDDCCEKCVINSLPDELLLRVFQLLPPCDLGRSVALVCTRWYALAMDPSLWLLDFRYSAKHAEEILAITAQLPWIRKIFLPDGCIPIVLAAVASWCPNLTHFDIGILHHKTERVHLIDMIHSAANITFLRVSSPIIDLEMIDLITTHMKHIRSFDFSFCTNLSDECIDTITKNVSFLELLNINGCELITDYGVETVLGKFSSTIQHLFLDGFYLSARSLSLLQNCKKLRTLSITYGSSLDDSCSEFLHQLDHLKEFIVRRSKTSMSGDTLTKLFSLTMSYRNFVYIDLTDCEPVDDSVVKIMCERCGMNLRCLVLAWCCNLTELSLIYVLDNCSKLVSLNMFGNYAIEGKALLDINFYNKMPFLLVLDFTCCDNVKEETLNEVSIRFPSLYIFDYLGDCVGHEEDTHYNIWKLQYRTTGPSTFRRELSTRAGLKNFNIFLESFRC